MPDVRVKFQGDMVDVREFVMDDFDAIYQDQYEQERRREIWLRENQGDSETPIPVCWFNRIFDSEQVTRKMVELATGLDVQRLQSARPSELRVLVHAVREANPDFFSLLTPPPEQGQTPVSLEDRPVPGSNG